jgi:hypothetical protein
MAEIAALRAELQVFQQQTLKPFDSKTFYTIFAVFYNLQHASIQLQERLDKSKQFQSVQVCAPIFFCVSFVFACVFVRAAVLCRPWAVILSSAENASNEQRAGSTLQVALVMRDII